MFREADSVFSASEGISEDDFRFGHFTLYFIITLIITGIVFELIRRTFYYIIFGTFKPNMHD